MKYLFNVQLGTKRLELTYDSKRNTLEGAGVPPLSAMPEGGQENTKQLRINVVMGVACNYHCGYCCQSGMKETVLAPRRTDAFIRKLRDYCDRHFSACGSARLMFWGGEPLLYFSLMRELAAGLKDMKTDVSMGICSNGALLDEENLAWLHDNGVGLGLSYDGPGQYARDKGDVLAPGSFALEALKDGLARHGWSVNPVFHKGNPLLSRFVSFMNERLGTENWHTGDIQALMVSDEASGQWALSEKEMYAFSVDCCREIFSGRGQQFVHTFHQAARGFLGNLGQTEKFGGCLNSNPDGCTLNVDISGHIWACHSCTGLAADELGGNLHIGDLDGPREPVEFAVLKRRRTDACADCVLRMFCGGGCAITPPQYDEVNCRIQWHKWFPALSLAVNMLTGGQLLGVKSREA